MLEEARKQAYRDKKEMAARVQARMNEENSYVVEQQRKDEERRKAEHDSKE